MRKRRQITKDKSILNRTTLELEVHLNEHKNNDIEYYLRNVTTTEATEHSLWKVTKKIKFSQTYIPPIRRKEEGLVKIRNCMASNSLSKSFGKRL